MKNANQSLLTTPTTVNRIPIMLVTKVAATKASITPFRNIARNIIANKAMMKNKLIVPPVVWSAATTNCKGSLAAVKLLKL